RTTRICKFPPGSHGGDSLRNRRLGLRSMGGECSADSPQRPSMHQPHVSSLPPHASPSVRSAGSEGADAGPEPRVPARRAGTWLFVLVSLVLIYFVGRVLLLAFAGVLLAVLLNGAAGWIAKKTKLSYGWSLTLVIVALLIVAGLAAWRLQSVITEQVREFSQAL